MSEERASSLTAAGQALNFHVRCGRLQDKIHDLQLHCDPILMLRNSAGVTIASRDNYFRADPLLSHRFEQEGDYVLEIRDVRYQGNQYWEYAIEISPQPLVECIFPLGVARGATEVAANRDPGQRRHDEGEGRRRHDRDAGAPDQLARLFQLAPLGGADEAAEAGVTNAADQAQEHQTRGEAEEDLGAGGEQCGQRTPMRTGSLAACRGRFFQG